MRTRILRGLIIAMLTLLFDAGGVFFPMQQSYADVTVEREDGTFPTIKLHIFDTISKNDANYISRHESDLEYATVKVTLDSIGGDVDAALQIGRIIRAVQRSLLNLMEKMDLRPPSAAA